MMKTRYLLIALFGGIFVFLLFAILLASADRNLFQAGRELMPSLWFQVTLIDAYAGFLTFYVWVAYRESSWWSRTAWLAAILLTGNLATAIYVLNRLIRHPGGRPLYELLLRPEHQFQADTFSSPGSI